jgi:hypothetical protein
MYRLQLRDDIFDNPAYDWVERRIDKHFRHRHLRAKGSIFCETFMTVYGTRDIDAAIDLICGPWDWWAHGRTAGFTANGDGSSDQILSPVWWFITRVRLHTLPPVPLPHLRGLRVPLLLDKHFTGPSSMDIYPGEKEDQMIVRGRFHGVDYHVPGVPNWVAEYLHLGAESGTMPAPFPKGTGWVGLLHKLEKPTTQDRDVMDLLRLSERLEAESMQVLSLK